MCVFTDFTPLLLLYLYIHYQEYVNINYFGIECTIIFV